MSLEFTAFAFGDGVIGFKQVGTGGLPEGALFLARGSQDRLQGVIGGLARRSYDGRTMLVPGVPEAACAADAYRAFQVFFENVQAQLGVDSNFQSVRTHAGAPW